MTEPAELAPAREDLTGKSRLVVNVVTSWIGQILVVIAGFFLPRVIDNNLGQAGLGIWDFAWSVNAYISLSHFGIGAALNRYVAKYRTAGDDFLLQRSVSTTIAIQFVLASAAILISIGIYFCIPIFLAERLGMQK